MSARLAGFSRQRVREYVPYPMPEVEVAADAVYAWAVERVIVPRLQGDKPTDPGEYAATVRHEAQALRTSSTNGSVRPSSTPTSSRVTLFAAKGRTRLTAGATQT